MSILPIIQSLITVIILMALGWGIKYFDWLKVPHWEGIEKLGYHFLFPAMIVYELAAAPKMSALNQQQIIQIFVVFTMAQMAMFALSFFAWTRKGMTGPRFTSIVQNNINWNSYVGMGLIASGILPPDALSIMAVAMAATIPTANLLSVWCLETWGKQKDSEPALLGVLKNPLIAASVIGIIIHVYRIELPDIILNPLMHLSQATLPLGLMVVGAGMNLSEMALTSMDRVFWSLFRLIVLPIMVYISCMLFGVTDTLTITVLLIAATVPTASNSYLVAKQLGGDAPFMASLVGTGSLYAVFTLPLILLTFMWLGLL